MFSKISKRSFNPWAAELVGVRGTQRTFSVKYLFAEANIAKNFLVLEYGYKFLDDCSIHVQFPKVI